jgi:hypothetical protein
MPQLLYRPEQLTEFLTQLGQRCDGPAKIYLFGGSALLVLGSGRSTDDIDFALVADNCEGLRHIIQALAVELDLKLKESAPSGYIPLPTGAEGRHQLIGNFNQVKAYLFDLYSIAVMKLDRGFEIDIEDVKFLLKAGYIELRDLNRFIEDVAKRLDGADRLRRNFAALRDAIG